MKVSINNCTNNRINIHPVIEWPLNASCNRAVRHVSAVRIAELLH